MTMPINLNSSHIGTVAFWRSAAPHYGARTWRGAMKAFARHHGKAIAILADDSAMFVTKDETKANAVHVEHLPADQVRWFKG